MILRHLIHRASEIALFQPRNRASSDPPVMHGSRYGILAQVSIRNTYYNNSEGRCPDFRVYPTAATRLLMATLGLLLKDEGIGFSVLYDMNRAENLFNFLRHQAERGFQVPEVTGVWTRLSFALSLRNPYFINFTAIPVDTEPTKLNFYFSNQEAHVGPGGEVILNQGKWVVADERLPVIPTQYQVLVSDRVMAVQVNAISGVEVITEPRCSSHVHSFENNFDKADIGVSSPPLFCSEIVYLNFSLLPEDKYTIEKIGYDGKPVEEPRPVLYTAPYPTPLCFIDLLFTDPLIEPGAPPSPSRAEGIYPVRDLWGINPSVVPVDYHLDFRRRRTIWNYYIAPQPGSEKLVDLRIVDVTRRDQLDPLSGKITFNGPCCVRLANGSTAYRFISKEKIPLEEQSQLRFQLRGRRKGLAPTESVLIDRLPVASSQQVLPLTREAVCEALQASLCEGAESRPRCREMIARMCNFAVDQPRGSPPAAVYSEIYVYV